MYLRWPSRTGEICGRVQIVQDDPVKYAIWIVGPAFLLTSGCALYIVWANSGSRNLVLGLGAFLGASAVFILQVIFELKASTEANDFPVEYIVDYKEKAVRGPKAYELRPNPSYESLFIEAEASKIIEAANPPLTKDDVPKIARDLAIVSILSYLLDKQFDWQLNAVTYKTTTGIETLFEPVSKPNDCTRIGVLDIHAKLKAAGNMFANVARLGLRDAICLPPHSEIEITPNGVTLRSFVCEIFLTVREHFASMSTIDPHKVARAVQSGTPIDVSSETLSDGSPRYWTIVFGGRAAVKFSPLRSGDRNLSKYQSWAKRITNGVLARFEPPG
jgi:hypothetical protein